MLPVNSHTKILFYSKQIKQWNDGHPLNLLLCTRCVKLARTVLQQELTRLHRPKPATDKGLIRATTGTAFWIALSPGWSRPCFWHEQYFTGLVRESIRPTHAYLIQGLAISRFSLRGRASKPLYVLFTEAIHLHSRLLIEPAKWDTFELIQGLRAVCMMSTNSRHCLQISCSCICESRFHNTVHNSCLLAWRRCWAGLPALICQGCVLDNQTVRVIHGIMNRRVHARPDGVLMLLSCPKQSARKNLPRILRTSAGTLCNVKLKRKKKARLRCFITNGPTGPFC